MGLTRSAAPSLLEAHLMIVDPDRYLDDFAQAGADLIKVHHAAGPGAGVQCLMKAAQQD